MKLEISTQSLINLFTDFKKKEIEPKEKASLLKQFREANGMSQRTLAKLIGISYSTIQDWELWNKVSKEQIKHAMSKGYTKTDIYRSLRNKAELVRIKKETFIIDTILSQATSDLKYYVNNENYSRNTELLIKELQNTLNRILIRIDKKIERFKY